MRTVRERKGGPCPWTPDDSSNAFHVINAITATYAVTDTCAHNDAHNATCDRDATNVDATNVDATNADATNANATNADATRGANGDFDFAPLNLNFYAGVSGMSWKRRSV